LISVSDRGAGEREERGRREERRKERKKEERKKEKINKKKKSQQASTTTTTTTTTTTKSLPTTHSVIVKKYPALKLSVNTQSLLKHGSSNNMRGPPTIKKAARTGRITRIGRELP